MSPSMVEEGSRGFKVRDRRRIGRGEPEKEKDPGEEGLPPADFSIFISSLTTTALYHLGDLPNPETGKVEKNLSLARHTIDTLAMLKEKTKGNLTKEEERLIEDSLYMLRMRYLREVK